MLLVTFLWYFIMIELIDLVYVGERIIVAGHEILPGVLGCLPLSVYSSGDYPGWVPVKNVKNEPINE